MEFKINCVLLTITKLGSIISNNICFCCSVGASILRNIVKSNKTSVNINIGKTYKENLLKNHCKSKEKAAQIKIFSEDENGVYKLPILIVNEIPNRYGAGLIFRILHALITKGIKIIATVISAIIAAERELIIQIK